MLPIKATLFILTVIILTNGQPKVERSSMIQRMSQSFGRFVSSIHTTLQDRSCNQVEKYKHMKKEDIDSDFESTIKHLSELSLTQNSTDFKCLVTKAGLEQQYHCYLSELYQQLSHLFLKKMENSGCQTDICSKPPVINHGYWRCDQDGDTCHVICHPGYKLKTKAHQSVFSAKYMECDHGDRTWNPPPEKFACECGGKLKDPENGEWECQTLEGGHTCMLSCALGLVPMPGSNVSCCGERWSDKMDLFRCEVPDLEAPANNVSRDDDVIFISGGFNYDNYKSEISTEVLDLNGNCSGFKYPLCKGRHGHTSHFYENALVICDTRTLDLSECIFSKRPAIGGWKVHSNPTSRRKNSDGVIVGESIVLVGGHFNGTAQIIESFKEGNWVNGTALPYNVGSGSCMVAVGEGKVIVSGGYFSQNRAAEYSIETREWRILPNMTQGRKNHGCGLIEVAGKKKMVVAGGYRLNSTNVLDLETEVWTKIGDMGSDRNNPEMVQMGNKLLVLGGSDRNWVLLNTVEQLGEDLKWKTLSLTRMKKGRDSFSAVVVPRILVCQN